MSERIGILTGGGDCPGLNAVIRAVVKAAAKRGWETIGILDGYEGLLDLRYRKLNYHEMDGLLLRESPRKQGNSTTVSSTGRSKSGRSRPP